MQVVEATRENPFLFYDPCPARPLDGAGTNTTTTTSNPSQTYQEPTPSEGYLLGRFGLYGSLKGKIGGAIKFSLNIDVFSFWTNENVDMTQGASIDISILGSRDYGFGFSRTNWSGGAPGAWSDWEWGGNAFNVSASGGGATDLTFGIGLGIGFEAGVPLINSAH